MIRTYVIVLICFAGLFITGCTTFESKYLYTNTQIREVDNLDSELEEMIAELSRLEKDYKIKKLTLSTRGKQEFETIIDSLKHKIQAKETSIFGEIGGVSNENSQNNIINNSPTNTIEVALAKVAQETQKIYPRVHESLLLTLPILREVLQNTSRTRLNTSGIMRDVL